MKVNLGPDVSFQVGSDEIALINKKSGSVYYFTKDSEDFFNYFSAPRTVENFLKKMNWELEDESGQEYLSKFVEFLLQSSIVEVSSAEEAEAVEPGTLWRRPAFVRQADYKIIDKAKMQPISPCIVPF